jgi:hypothetical protein
MATNPCTRIYFEAVPGEEEPRFERRFYTLLTHFFQPRFKSSPRVTPEQVRPELLALQQELLSMKLQKQREQQLLRKRTTDLSMSRSSQSGSRAVQGRLKLDRQEQVNEKRARIAMFLQMQTVPNLKEIARLTGTCFETVKRVKQELEFADALQPYRYNNVKSQDELWDLHKTLQSVHLGYDTVTELKRAHPTFSRKRILLELRRTGHRWRQVRLPREKEPPKRFSSSNICRVISHLCQTHFERHKQVKMLYVDEMKFPLRQNSYFHWGKVKTQDPMVFGKRPVDDVELTVIALCSTERFLAVQVFTKAIDGHDFVCFLNEAVQQLPLGVQYSILADNATWHVSEFVRKQEVFKFLFLNEPGMYRLNLIENAFSHIRDTFRKRPLVDSLGEEARMIVNMFFDEKSTQRFAGYFRHHTRQLIKYLDKHSKNL